MERARLHGIVSDTRALSDDPGADPALSIVVPPGTELLRPLAEYEQVTGGGW